MFVCILSRSCHFHGNLTTQTLFGIPAICLPSPRLPKATVSMEDMEKFLPPAFNLIFFYIDRVSDIVSVCGGNGKL